MGTIGSLVFKKDLKTTLVSNKDILIKTDFKTFLIFIKRGKPVIIVGSVRHFEIPYGVCTCKNSGSLKRYQKNQAMII